MAFGAVDLNRDLTLPVEEIRSATPGFVQNKECPDKDTMASLPELRRGRIAAALVKVATRIQRPGNVLWGYRTGEIAYSAAQAQLAYYRILEKRGKFESLPPGKISWST